MTQKNARKLTVFYDGACPTCVRDRAFYEQVAGNKKDEVEWCDITGQESALRQEGIDPKLALKELHVKTPEGHIVSELDAYILLMKRTFWLKPLAWLIGLPLIRSLLARLYHYLVQRRLRRSGRL
jgi:predicted DCC family thiol-disulfide oxidoreductase YuxK|tara:strand:- start:688 stop:1062 length:375 start_codon:yes stop_codon:yes gene_type:complete